MAQFCILIISWTLTAELLFPLEMAIPASINYLLSFAVGFLIVCFQENTCSKENVVSIERDKIFLIILSIAIASMGAVYQLAGCLLTAKTQRNC